MLFQEALDSASLDFESKLDFEIAKLLNATGLSLAVGETLTGGMLGQRIHRLPGSPAFFRGGVICDHPIAKIQVCGVAPATIKKYGPISKEVALEIAEGLKKRFASDLSIGVSGIADTEISTGSENKIGKVYIGFVLENQTKVKEFQFTGTKETIQNRTIVAALGILRQWLETKQGVFRAAEQ
jgi:nicotinamide-nucleotide amidase